MNGKKNNKGFTMAEMLITVAILVVLAALAFIGVSSYMKNMHQLEMDSIAREIFVSAQNHLSMAASQGFPGMNGKEDAFGHEDSQEPGVYYFTFGSGSDNPENTDSVFSLMLPFGSVDETVRAGGTYIIQYQKSPAIVLGVFYATRTGRYSVGENGFSDSDDDSDDGSNNGDYYGLFHPTDGKQYTESKDDRKDYNGAVVGYYGGEGLQPGADLKAPTIEITNAEVLQVKIKDENVAGYKVQLFIKGLTSNGQAYKTWESGSSPYVFTLDNICEDNYHFAELFGTQTSAVSGESAPTFYVSDAFIPGENISVQAKVFSSTALTNVATSDRLVTNSLFDTGTTVTNDKEVHAIVSNIRHLENLSKNISMCGTGDSFYVTDAVQTRDLTWGEFRYAETIDSTAFAIIPQLGSDPVSEVFRAVEPGHALNYDGGYHTISPGVTAGANGSPPAPISSFPIDETSNTSNGNAGLFSNLLEGCYVKNLELIDFSVAGTTSAGVLAGSLTNCTVSNVLARNSSDAAAVNVSASGSAGGLIGSMNGGTVQYSAAAVIIGSRTEVSGGTSTMVTPTKAGGLIGTASGTITGCYSGGHTSQGSYREWLKDSDDTYDVTGATAGGLVGSSSGTITNSYSTCSVSGTTVGGFVGSSTGSITDCYCTGLVAGTTSMGAFSGPEYGSLSGNTYYSIINEKKDGAGKYTGEYLPAVSGTTSDPTGISPFDSSITEYEKIAMNTQTAYPYDDDGDSTTPDLRTYYQGKYFFKGIADFDGTTAAGKYVKDHYGDWPAPEIFVINNKASNG